MKIFFSKIDPHFENGVKVKQSLVQIESSLTSMFQSNPRINSTLVKF